MENSFFRVIPSIGEAADRLIDDAIGFLLRQRKELGPDDPVVFHFKLALDETIENALKHGNRENAGKMISVSIDVCIGNITIMVRDEGNGFLAENTPDPLEQANFFKLHGRDIHLLKNLFDVSWLDEGRCIKIVMTLD